MHNDSSWQKKMDKWLLLDEETKQEILALQKSSPEELEKRFSHNLAFGTAGARAIMGVGTNRFNIYTIRLLTYAVGQYLRKQKKSSLKVLIGYDVRINSTLFAEETAKVLAAMNIEAHFFPTVATIGLLSFGIRFLNADAGIMITASHNPKSYNGFKVYGADGGQILASAAGKITAELIDDPTNIPITNLINPHIIYMHDEIKKAFLENLLRFPLLGHKNHKDGDKLSIVYSNLHGGGLVLVPDALKSWGFTSLTLVEEQKNLDGSFPNATSPNPEDPIAMKFGIEKMLKTEANLFIATDPDCDRLGVVVRHKNQPVILSGNQVGALLLYHIAYQKQLSSSLPKNGAVVKSIVTSNLLSEIAESFHLRCFNVLTGFKYAADLVQKWHKTHEYSFLFAAEESCGYLAVDFVRDKEAVSAACLVCELALHLQTHGKTLVDCLHDLYRQYGIFKEKTLSFALTEKNQKILHSLRENPPSSLGGMKITQIDDYQKNVSLTIATQKTVPIHLPASNVMGFTLEDGSRFILRPSGTEPKMKCYLSVREKVERLSFEETMLLCEKRLADLEKALKEILNP